MLRIKVLLTYYVQNSPFKVSFPPHCDLVQDDETMTETTDDVVAEAFGHLNEQDFNDDEEVLYPR